MPAFRIAALPGEGVGPEIIAQAQKVLEALEPLGFHAEVEEEGARGMFEAGHGTALDIAGRDVANPIACIRALGLLLRHSGRRPDLSAIIEVAIRSVLRQGYRTADIRCSNTRLVGTERMGDLIANAVGSGSRPTITEH